MGTSPFTLIHQNQTAVSCVIAITLSVATLVVSVLILQEVIDYEERTVNLIYEQGYVDAHRHVILTRDSKIIFPGDLEMSRKFLLTLKIICGMGFTASLLHFISSAWTLYKKSRMSIQVWLVANALAFCALLTALILPIMYRKFLDLQLKIFCAVTCVDASLTFLLLLVVFLDMRSNSNDEEQNAINTDDEEDSTPNVAATTTSVSEKVPDENESLPPPPPPPTTEATSIS